MATEPMDEAAILAPLRVLELTTGYWVPQAISVAATLGVADHLADGPMAVEDLGAAVGADATSLHRLLRTLADIDVFDELDGRRFALTPVSNLLRADVPGSMRGWACLIGLPAWRAAWSGLLDSVVTGEPAFERIYGQNGFEYMADHPDEALVFDQAMAVLSTMLILPVVDVYDFGAYGTVADVGGGNGNLLAAILRANPDTRGILFDLPHAVAAAPPVLEEAGVADRCEVVGGSFFDEVPTGADAYVLASVIHDWDDDRAVRILTNCRDARGDGTVLVLVPVLPEGPEPSMAKVMDLEALVVTPGGRERTEPELRALFGRAGLEITGIVPAGLYSVLEARR